MKNVDRDNVVVTVVLRAELARKMVGPWYLLKHPDREEIREAFKNSISWMGDE